MDWIHLVHDRVLCCLYGNDLPGSLISDEFIRRTTVSFSIIRLLLQVVTSRVVYAEMTWVYLVVAYLRVL
jgi:hypothetical protein